MVGTATSTIVVIAMIPTPTSTIGATNFRFQPVRLRTASTTGINANASSEAMTMSASVRGIERTSQIATARIANATQIGIADRGSMSMRRPGTGGSAIGGIAGSEGPSKLA